MIGIPYRYKKKHAPASYRDPSIAPALSMKPTTLLVSCQTPSRVFLKFFQASAEYPNGDGRRSTFVVAWRW